MLKEKKIIFAGSGNMAEAFMHGLLVKELVSPRQILATGPREESGEEW